MGINLQDILGIFIKMYTHELGAWIITTCLLIGLLHLPGAIKCAAYEAKNHGSGLTSRIIKELKTPINYIAACVVFYLIRLFFIHYFKF